MPSWQSVCLSIQAHQSFLVIVDPGQAEEVILS